MSAPHVVVVGNVNVDMIMGPQQPWPRAGTEVVLPHYELRVGGSAGNAALALQALGVPILLLANAGDDVLGRWLRDGFGKAAGHWRLAARPTTVSIGITHPNGERTFFTNQGHLEALGPEDVLPHLGSRAPGGSIALLCGAFLSPLLVDAFPSILTTLRSAGYRIALDTGWPPAGWTKAVRATFSEWLQETDLLLFNEAEAVALSSAAGVEHAIDPIRSLMPLDATLVIKRGAQGASAWHGDEAVSFEAPPIEVMDSIGAGDIFNAGFLDARIRGAALREALRSGVAFASAVIATHPRRYDPVS